MSRETFSVRQSGLLAGLLMLISAAIVVSTYARLSRTADETFHVYCGMEWWNQGTYNREPKHPPLTRVMAAAPFHLLGITGAEDMRPLPGMSAHDSYSYKTFLMRLGTLPFYMLSCLAVFCWSRELFGNASALASLLLYVFLPTPAAHGGLAATDMGCAAGEIWALLGGLRWLKHPTKANACLFGIAMGLMIGSKFSALVQWPAAMALILMVKIYSNYRQVLPLVQPRAAHFKSLWIMLACLLLALGAVYRFSFGALIQGLIDIKHMNDDGFALWLLGPLNNHNVWYFFPVVFFFKTPLPFLGLSAWGVIRAAASLKRRAALERMFPLLASIGILLSSMPSHINLGVRHVLTLYPLLAIPAGYGLMGLWQSDGKIRPVLAAALLAWQIAGFAQIYPDFIAYYNELGGEHPERISLDSDFDWGQDIVMLDDALQERNIHEFYACARKINIMPHNLEMLLHARALDCPSQQVSGWIAVSRAQRLLKPDNFAWLLGYKPVQPVGKTIDLYYIPAH